MKYTSALSWAHNFFEASSDKLSDSTLDSHHQETDIVPVYESGKNWSLVFNFYLQRYIKYAVMLGSYETLGGLRAFRAEDERTYEEYIFYVVNDAVDRVLPFIDGISMSIYFNLLNDVSNTRTLLFAVLIASMAAAVIGYGLIVPRILNVLRKKAEVMKLFADIPTKTVKEIIADLSSFSLTKNAEAKRGKHNTVHKTKMIEETQLNKNTEAVFTQAAKTTSGEVRSTGIVEEQMEMRILEKKRKTLESADQGTKWRSIITISGFFFVVLGYYGASIGITGFIFSQFKDLTENVRWVSFRQAALTYPMVSIRELITDNSDKYEDIVIRDIEILYKYERMVQTIIVSASGIYKNFLTLTNALNGPEFCNTIKDYLEPGNFERCKQEGDYSMARGIQNNVYQVIAYLNSLYAQYDKQKGADRNPAEIIGNSDWDIARKLA